MEKNQLKATLEAILFVSPEPLSVQDLNRLVNRETDERKENEPQIAESSPLEQLQNRQALIDQGVTRGEVAEALREMTEEYGGNPARGFQLVEVAGGYQLRTKKGFASVITQLSKVARPRLTSPSMETVAIVAYRQPVTRADIEQIRGVDSGGVLKTLLERDLIRLVGRSEEPGRPLLYGTTKTFLETFSLKTLSDLPDLKDFEALDPAAAGAGAAEGGKQEGEGEVILAEGETPFDDTTSPLIDELDETLQDLKKLETEIFADKKDEENPEA